MQTKWAKSQQLFFEKLPKKEKQWYILHFCVKKPKHCPISENFCAIVRLHGRTFRNSGECYRGLMWVLVNVLKTNNS